MDERKSTSGYTFLLNNRVVSWRSKKKTSVTLSTMETEYISMSVAVQEAFWLKRLINYLGLTASQDPMTIDSDSKALIAYSKDPMFHGRTKYIEALLCKRSSCTRRGEFRVYPYARNHCRSIY